MKCSYRKMIHKISRNWLLYLFLLPAVVYIIMFCYKPMTGIVIAFKDFKPRKGIAASPWAANNGFYHFTRFVHMHNFWTLIENTLSISLYSLLLFPLPIILALMMNLCEKKAVKSLTQYITYAPHFISTVVVVGMINIIFSPRTGIVSRMLNSVGLIDGYLNVLTSPAAFKHLYVWSGEWQGVGWGSIIYLAALSSVDSSLHEAAVIDGASRFQRVVHIDIPCILPTIIIMLILRMGRVMSVGYEKAYLMQNALNIPASEIISTYVYKQGLIDTQYSFAAAVGLFNSVINVILLLIFNGISRRISDTSLF